MMNEWYGIHAFVIKPLIKELKKKAMQGYSDIQFQKRTTIITYVTC